MSVTIRASADDTCVPPEILSTIFYSTTVSDTLAILVAETVDGEQRLTWGNEGAVHALGYGLEDLRRMPVGQLFPTLGLAVPMTGGHAAAWFAARTEDSR